ncbi:MAG: class I SAM-dependent methyltransferase, partial [Anaerolineae bacterium]|nr:class I SAM-dependent methyltransferase [Anaerolineae bacterium]
GHGSIFEDFVSSAPHAQNALDIFGGEWVSKLPQGAEGISGGTSHLFEDGRITWFLEQIGSIEGKNILELGPLEGGHTYMLANQRAASITAIESNPRAYLKCLIIKEMFGLQQANFLCGDFVKYLESNPPRFHMCLASGVLYHMTDPVQLIGLLAHVADHLCLWTHYYDETIIAQKPHLAAQFTEQEALEVSGFRHTVFRRVYPQRILNWTRFHGGSAPYACWLSREDILNCLSHFGYRDIQIGIEEPDHQHGPSFAVTASR